MCIVSTPVAAQEVDASPPAQSKKSRLAKKEPRPTEGNPESKKKSPEEQLEEIKNKIESNLPKKSNLKSKISEVGDDLKQRIEDSKSRINSKLRDKTQEARDTWSRLQNEFKDKRDDVKLKLQTIFEANPIDLQVLRVRKPDGTISEFVIRNPNSGKTVSLDLAKKEMSEITPSEELVKRLESNTARKSISKVHDDLADRLSKEGDGLSDDAAKIQKESLDLVERIIDKLTDKTQPLVNVPEDDIVDESLLQRPNTH